LKISQRNIPRTEPGSRTAQPTRPHFFKIRWQSLHCFKCIGIGLNCHYVFLIFKGGENKFPPFCICLVRLLLFWRMQVNSKRTIKPSLSFDITLSNKSLSNDAQLMEAMKEVMSELPENVLIKRSRSIWVTSPYFHNNRSVIVDGEKCKMEGRFTTFRPIFSLPSSVPRSVLVSFGICYKSPIKFSAIICQIRPTFLGWGLLIGGWTTPEAFLLFLEVILS